MVQVAEIKMHVVDQASLMVTTEFVDVCTPVSVVPHVFTLLQLTKWEIQRLGLYSPLPPLSR